MEYRSVANLNDRIADWIPALPRNIDVIAGVPRSGMLAANLLALHLNLPLTDVQGLAEGRLMHAGNRFRGADLSRLLDNPVNVLVVDDSCYTGGTLSKVKTLLSEARLPHTLHYGAVFVTPEAVREGKVELLAEVVPWPRVFEWNVMHHDRLSRFCVDIDGVLCHDPSAAANDDGERYLRFLEAAEPLFVPAYEVGWLITSRLEKYRKQTEQWLDRHGIRYRELVMMQYPDMATRKAANAYSKFKADAYLRTGADLFIESEAHTAAEITKLARRPVFCVDTRQMLYPDDRPRPRHIHVRPLHPVEKALRWALRPGFHFLRDHIWRPTSRAG